MEKTKAQKADGRSCEFRVSLWKDEREIKLTFPEEWDPIECRMAGHDFPPLSDSQIQEAFENPIGTSTIQKLARGKQKVVILFDDLARPTPTQKILPFIFKELAEGGVSADNITLVCGTGCHRPLTREEMIRKFGHEVVENYLCFNHNLYEHHVHMGTTSRGTPVLINREVAGCDLKIGVGSIIPHHTAGFGGGAKILMPGVSAIDTVAHNHVEVANEYADQVGYGKVKNNPMRLDMEEVARIAGLDVLVDVVLNHRKEILGIFVGDVVEGHREGVAFANKTYCTENRGKSDLMVVNTFPIEESPGKALWPARESLNDGGDVVVIWQNTGRLPHYLVGTWGSDYGGRKWAKPGPFRFPQARKLFVYTESLSKVEQQWWGPEDKVLWYRDWKQLIDALNSRHGSGTRVIIYPYATLQCPVFAEE